MKRPQPPTYFFTALLLIGVLHFALPVMSVVHMPWRLLGVIPLLLGAILNLMADGDFKRYRTTVKPFEVSSTLVTGGVFRTSRNPMYVGMTLILVGVALLAGSAASWIPAGIFAILMDRLFIEPEEAMLEAEFGDEFREYRKKARRWI